MRLALEMVLEMWALQERSQDMMTHSNLKSWLCTLCSDSTTG